MQLYTEAFQSYIRKPKIMNIYYLKIHSHKITVHTAITSVTNTGLYTKNLLFYPPMNF